MSLMLYIDLMTQIDGIVQIDRRVVRKMNANNCSCLLVIET